MAGSQRVPGGLLVMAPHKPENVPRNCWTCIHRLTADTMTTCKHIDNPTHTKLGTEPCEKYDLNAVWLEVDWFYPDGKRKRMGE